MHCCSSVKFYPNCALFIHDGKEEHPHECEILASSLKQNDYHTIIITHHYCCFPIVSAERLIVYITGHGVENGFLLSRKIDFWIEYLIKLRTQCDHILLIVSACFSGTFVEKLEPCV